MKLLQRIFADHRFDEWASDQALIAARVLNQAAGDLILLAEQDLASAGWKDGLFDPNAFIRERIAPRIRDVAEPLALAIIEEANRSLQSLIDLQAIWTRRIEPAPLGSNNFEGAGDIAAAVVPLGTGAAAAAALPFAAVTTTSAMFGLVTTTAISWPIVLGGGALASLGLVTGVIETGKIWSKVEARLRRRSRDFIVAALLKGDAEHPSVLEQLTGEFQRVAATAKAAT
jgi:hypothetical protein